MPPPSLPPPLSVRSSHELHQQHSVGSKDQQQQQHQNQQAHSNAPTSISSFSIPSLLPSTLALPPGTPLSQQAPPTPSTVGVDQHTQPQLQ